MRIQKPEKDTCNVKCAYERLGVSRSIFYNSGIGVFLEYYQEEVKRGKRFHSPKEYLIADINRFRYWLMVRGGMIALGHWASNIPLLPEGETMQAKRNYFDAWLVEDLYGAECPRCEGPAVQGEMGGKIWCPECGIDD